MTDGSGESFSLTPVGGGTYSFSLSGNDVATGTLYTSPSGLGDDSVWVTGGTMHVTATSTDVNWSGFPAVGNYTIGSAGPALRACPASRSTICSTRATTRIAPATVVFDQQRAVFRAGRGSGAWCEVSVNIWGNGGGDYAFYSFANALPRAVQPGRLGPGPGRSVELIGGGSAGRRHPGVDQRSPINLIDRRIGLIENRAFSPARATFKSWKSVVKSTQNAEIFES